jgi:hypothetical protein
MPSQYYEQRFEHSSAVRGEQYEIGTTVLDVLEHEMHGFATLDQRNKAPPDTSQARRLNPERCEKQ